MSGESNKEMQDMSRRSNTAEVDVPETEEVAGTEETTEQTAAAPKAKKEPARGELPEGFVTPHGFAKELTQRELHTARDGSHEVRPQMVYSYIRNASKSDPFPVQTVKDSLDHDRQVVNLEEGLAWWQRKNERVATSKANAAAKAEKKAQAAAAKPAAEAEGSGDSDSAEPAVEAE